MTSLTKSVSDKKHVRVLMPHQFLDKYNYSDVVQEIINTDSLKKVVSLKNMQVWLAILIQEYRK